MRDPLIEATRATILRAIVSGGRSAGRRGGHAPRGRDEGAARGHALALCLTGVTLGLGGAACGGAEARVPTSAADSGTADAKDAFTRAKAAQASAAAEASPAGAPRDPAARPPALSLSAAPTGPIAEQVLRGKVANFGVGSVPVAVEPIPGDPPFVDGYHPGEEETCPSGNWCAPPAVAQAIAWPGLDDVDGCPSKLKGRTIAEGAVDMGARVYRGISSEPAMQASFNANRTALFRERTGDATLCCYHWFEYCAGRPLLTDPAGTVAVVAELGPAGAHWCEFKGLAEAVARDRLSGARREAAAQWRRDGLDEHAAIAAFERAAAELRAVGAPAELCDAHLAAADDERVHTRLAFAIAAGLDGARIGPLEAPDACPRPLDLAAVATAALREGAIGESIAATVARRAAAEAHVPEIAVALAQIADDEAEHAALAWRVVLWAVDVGGPAVRSAVMDALRTAAAAHTGRGELDETSRSAALRRYGVLDATTRAELAAAAWDGVVAPLAAELLGGELHPAAPRLN